MGKARVPAAEGWFTTEGEPHLLGTRCTACGAVFFPRAASCRNPACGGTELAEQPLGRRGRLWSWTNSAYPPPPPYPAREPFRPYAIAAVELPEERMVILGQVAAGKGVADLRAGMEMELVVEPLWEDERNQYLVWKWRPTEA